jgi:ElaA protein
LHEGGEVVAYARVLKANTYLDEIAIGRVIAVRRSEGYGMQIFGHAIDAAVEKFGAERIKIRAQQQAEKFYHKFGFKACGEPFMYEGLMHIDMLWEKTN